MERGQCMDVLCSTLGVLLCPPPRQPLSRMCCTFAGVKLCGLGTSAELTPAIPRSTGGLGDRNQLPIIFQTLVS